MDALAESSSASDIDMRPITPPPTRSVQTPNAPRRRTQTDSDSSDGAEVSEAEAPPLDDYDFNVVPETPPPTRSVQTPNAPRRSRSPPPRPRDDLLFYRVVDNILLIKKDATRANSLPINPDELSLDDVEKVIIHCSQVGAQIFHLLYGPTIQKACQSVQTLEIRPQEWDIMNPVPPFLFSDSVTHLIIKGWWGEWTDTRYRFPNLKKLELHAAPKFVPQYWVDGIVHHGIESLVLNMKKHDWSSQDSYVMNRETKNDIQCNSLQDIVCCVSNLELDTEKKLNFLLNLVHGATSTCKNMRALQFKDGEGEDITHEIMMDALEYIPLSDIIRSIYQQKSALVHALSTVGRFEDYRCMVLQMVHSNREHLKNALTDIKNALHTIHVDDFYYEKHMISDESKNNIYEYFCVLENFKKLIETTGLFDDTLVTNDIISYIQSRINAQTELEQHFMDTLKIYVKLVFDRIIIKCDSVEILSLLTDNDRIKIILKHYDRMSSNIEALRFGQAATQRLDPWETIHFLTEASRGIVVHDDIIPYYSYHLSNKFHQHIRQQFTQYWFLSIFQDHTIKYIDPTKKPGKPFPWPIGCINTSTDVMCEWGELYNFLRAQDIGIIIPRMQKSVVQDADPIYLFKDFGNAINGRWTDLTEGIGVYDIIMMEDVNIVCPCRSVAPGCTNHIVSAQTMHAWLSTPASGYPYNNTCPKCRQPLEVVEIMSLEQLRLRKDALAKEPPLINNVVEARKESERAAREAKTTREAVQQINAEAAAIEHAAAAEMGQIAMEAARKVEAIAQEIKKTKKKYNKKKRKAQEQTIAGQIKKLQKRLARDITVKLKF